MLIDTHAHLTDERLARKLVDVLDRAWNAGVGQVVAPGTTASDSATVCALAAEHAGVFAAVAIHPNEGADAKANDFDAIAALAAFPEVVAIGETGLDRYWNRTPFPLQQELFDRHLALARERDLPVIIHCRDCYADVIAQIERQRGAVRGVLHAFTGTLDDAQALLELGLHLSFAGMITFANKALDPLRAVAASVPAERLLIETDSPYLAPHPFRGQTNEPAHLVHTAERLAQLRGITPDELARITTANARTLFGLMPMREHEARATHD